MFYSIFGVSHKMIVPDQNVYISCLSLLSKIRKIKEGDGETKEERRMMLRIRGPQVRAHKRKREHCCIGRSPMSAHLKIWSTRITTTSYVTLLRVVVPSSCPLFRL